MSYAALACAARPLICDRMIGAARRSMEEAPEVTVLLQAWSAGDRSVEDALFSLLLPDLRRIAKSLVRRERAGHSLESTALVNEAYLRLVRERERDWQSRQHFLAFAARAMRNLLIDHARGRAASRKLPLDEFDGLLDKAVLPVELAIAIDALLHQLETVHPDWCSIVEMKFFAGFTDAEAAEAIGIPLRSVQRKFGDARRWLFERMEPNHGNR